MEKKWITKPTTILMLALIATALWGSAYPTVKLGMEWFGITPDDSASKLLFAGVRERVSEASVPQALRGLPVDLMIGTILSMAVMAF